MGTENDKSGTSISGNREVRGPLHPDHGGTGDAEKDFDKLTGGTGKPFPDSDGRSKKPCVLVGDNGIWIRPGTKNASDGARIEIPGNGNKPQKLFTINLECLMKNVFPFEGPSTSELAAGLRSGLAAFGTNVPKVGPPATVWLRLGDGRTVRVGVEMHDLPNWEEVGTLTFEIVDSKDVPNLVDLAASWLDVQHVHKLVYISEECEAESGFALTTERGETLTVLPGADIFTLAIKAPFYSKPFNPENDLPVYIRKEL